jgi:hypothetical protein
MMIQRTLPDLIGLINAGHARCVDGARNVIADAIEVGQYLTEAKGRLGHGEWIPWVEANLDFGRVQAWKYMRAYDRREMFSPTEHFGGLEGFVKSLADPRPALDPPPGSSWIPAEISAAVHLSGPPAVDVPESTEELSRITVAGPVPTITPVPIADLKAPWPYFGGKRKAAGLIWARLGRVRNYIEPFGGTAAVLLARPDPPQIETASDPSRLVDNFRRAAHPERGDPAAVADALCEILNDADPHIANLWRSIREAPEETAAWADNPVDESFLQAVHRYLILGDDAARFRERVRDDMDYFDARRAGLWAWGACTWIGSGWCRVPSDESRAAAEPPDKLPRLVGGRRGDTYYGDLGVNAGKRPALCNGSTRSGPGVHRRSHRPQLADAYSRGRGVHSHDEAETCQERREWLVDWFRQLRDRLRLVRVCCGDWRRVCGSPSVTTRLGLTGIFFDPPYSSKSGRTKDIYGVDSLTVAHDVQDYCLKHGDDPGFRIVLAGLAGEGHEVLEEHGWTVVPWTSQGGYGNRTSAGKERAKREQLWCSPHTLRGDVEPSLFDGMED